MTTVLLAGCSAAGPPPLGQAGDPGTQGIGCWPQHKPVTIGLWDLRNSSKSPVTIQSIRLPSAHGLTMTKAWLLPLARGVNAVGVGWPYPPANTAEVRAEWAQRKPAVGDVIRPSQHLLLVFGLVRTTARAGKSGGPVIVYTADGSSYILAEDVSLVMAPNC